MNLLLPKFLPGPPECLSVAALAPRHYKSAVASRDVATAAVGGDRLLAQRILTPHTAQKAPARPLDENPEATRRDARQSGSGRRQDGSGAASRRERLPEQRVIDVSGGGRDRARDPDQVGAGAVDRERPRHHDHDRDRGRGRDRRLSANDSGQSRQQRDERRSRDRPPLEPPTPPLPLDSKTARSPRYLAVQQLVRVEEGGAYVGLVNGSPAAVRGRLGRRDGDDTDPRVIGGALDDEFELEDDDAKGVDGGYQAAQWRRRGGRRELALDPRGQRLLKELVAGVTRLRRRLDFVASNLSQQTPADMQPELRQVLRLGLYELTERRLPPHALNEHVQLAKVVSGPGAGSFVNGVLRAAARRLEEGTLPTPESQAPAGEAASTTQAHGPRGGGSSGREALRRLALQHSHPNWLVSRWLERFGREGAEALMRRNNQPPVYTVRVNTLRPGGTVARVLESLAAAGVEAEPSPVLPEEFIRVRAGLQKLLAEGFVSDGSLFVQDESAGLVVALLDPQPGDRVLDCCAAPGGKTLFAAARMRGRGSITALDISAPRLGALRRAAALAGVDELVTTQAADLRQWAQRLADRAAWRAEIRTSPAASLPSAAAAEWQRRVSSSNDSSMNGALQPEAALLYDKVLLDAPCTGTGVLAKRADLRWRRTPDQLHELTALQDQLLDSAAGLVAPGGVLVYSTCSIEKEEDQERVRAFLGRHPEFELDPAGPAAVVAAGRQPGRPRVPPEVLSPEGFVATLPHVHDTDGAFAARLLRRRQHRGHEART